MVCLRASALVKGMRIGSLRENRKEIADLSTRCGLSKNISTKGPRNRRSLRSASPDFLWTLMALADLMRLSLRERRTRGLV